MIEAVGSSRQRIEASSEFLLKVDTSDNVDQRQLGPLLFDQALLMSILELWNKKYGQ